MIIVEGPKGRREIPDGEAYGRNERMVGSYKTGDAFAAVTYHSGIPAGDLAAALLKTVGFKSWWDKVHGGECLPCKHRQAAANYVKLMGPDWLARWVNKHKEGTE